MALSPAQRPLRADVLLARRDQKKLRSEKTTRDIKVLVIANVGLLLLQLLHWLAMDAVAAPEPREESREQGSRREPSR